MDKASSSTYRMLLAAERITFTAAQEFGEVYGLPKNDRA